MPEGVAVRCADLADARDLAAYLAMLDAYARDPLGAGQPLEPRVRERLARDLPSHPTLVALLAEHDTDAIGFATCFVGYSTFLARPLLNLHDIAVLPAWRGRGVADVLLAAVERQARERDCCRLTLEVRDDNPRAQAVYRRFGFRPAACNLFLEKPLE